MQQLLATISEAISAMHPAEGVAVLFSMTYVILAAREHAGCWLAAIVSNCLFIWLFYDAQLYAKILLRTFYLGLAFYGYYQWKYGYKNRAELPVRLWPLRFHFIAIVSCSLLSLLSGYLLSRFTNGAAPYLDAATTVFPFFVTWLVARKYLGNWLYWIVIDGASIALYADRELYLTALLYGFFSIAAVAGFFSWRRSYKARLANA